MEELPDGEVDLIISSPPYWTAIDYHAFAEGRPHLWEGTDTYAQYLLKLEEWYRECFRVLRSGRYCISVLGTLERDGKTYPIPFDALQIFQNIGFQFEYEIIWNKVSGGRQSARNFIRHPKPGKYRPNIRTEYILVLRKDPSVPFSVSQDGEPGEIEFEVDGFFARETANNIWNIPPRNQARDRKHPCPFPIELPYRLIELFSVKGDVILDPFMGIGTTAKAAKMLHRKFVGYEIEDAFRNAASELINDPDQDISKTVSEYRRW